MNEFYTYAWQKFLEAERALRDDAYPVRKRVNFAWMSLVQLSRSDYFPNDLTWREFKKLKDEVMAKRIDVGGHPVVDCTDEWAEAHSGLLLSMWERLDRLRADGKW